MNSDHWIFVSAGDHELCPTIAIHGDCFACASTILQITRNHITVGTRRETSLQRLVQIRVIVVDDQETCKASSSLSFSILVEEGRVAFTFITTGKSDLIVSIVPPVSHGLGGSSVTETTHVVDLSPTMFTDPSTATAHITRSRDGRTCRSSFLIGAYEFTTTLFVLPLPSEGGPCASLFRLKL